MRANTALWLVFGLTGSLLRPVLAQAAGMPECASNCLTDSLKQVPVCEPTDIQCLCTNPELNAAIQACVGASCTIKEVLTSTNMTMTMCGAPIRDRTHIIPIVSGVSGLFALIATIVRTVAAGKKFWVDDGFVVVAMAGAIPMDIMQLYTGPAGFGRDIWTVPFENLYYILKLVYITQVLYYPVSGFTKLAFLFFYIRIFPRENFRKILYVLIALSVGYTIAFDFAMAFSAWPTSYAWTAWDGEHKGHSVDVNKLIYAGGAVNIALDVAIILAPIPELFRLSMSLKKKIAISSIFSVGTFTLIVSCIRLHQVRKFALTTNATWDNVPSAYWSMLEVNVGIFCVCMPAFRRAVARVLPSFISFSKAKAKDSNKYNDVEDGKQDSGFSSGERSNKKRKKRSFGASLLETDVTKTVDAKIETVSKEHGDDEIQLVDMRRMRGPSDASNSVQHE